LKGELGVTDSIHEVMANAAYEALFVVDANLNILGMNAQAAAFWGEQSQVGQSLMQVAESSELEAAFQYVIENHEPEFEVQTTIQDRFYRVRMRHYRITGGAVQVGVAVQDVTDLVRLNRARRDMVANISHELRTPIANIRLIIDGLFHEADKPKRKKSIQSLKDIAREADALQWLVHELMDLSMIESGQAIVRMVDVDLEEMVQEVLERMADQAASREIAFVAKLPRKIHVLCDRELTKRVLINLIHNSLKYAPGGTLVNVSAESQSEYVVLTVSDKGPGVPADQTTRVFERFYQVDSSRSRNEGTGLGLAICKHVVEAHGGKIWAEGVETAGGGQFSFSLLNADYALEDDEGEAAE
jgi:two-component system, OmpR family, phosphate regulon sensor histidine kinase PhoR